MLPMKLRPISRVTGCTGSAQLVRAPRSVVKASRNCRAYGTSQPTWASPSEIIGKEDQERLAELKTRFQMADVDGNGSIDKDELRNLLNSVEGGETYLLTQFWFPEEELDSVLKYYDTDGNGTITFDEFIKLMTDGLLLEGTLEDYEAAFKAVDTSGNGTIGATELGEMFERLGEKVSFDKLFEIMEKYDKDESGQIDFNEFLLMFRDKLLDVKSVLNFMKSDPKESQTIIETSEGRVALIFHEDELNELATKNEFVVIFCGLTWCRPCKSMMRPFEKLAAVYPNMTFLKLYGNSNASTKKLFKERFKVRSTPCFIIIHNGNIVHTQTGRNKEKLEQAIRNALAGTNLPETLVYPPELAKATV